MIELQIHQILPSPKSNVSPFGNKKKAPRVEAPERLYFQCGEYRNRTDDLLTASHVNILCNALQIH